MSFTSWLQNLRTALAPDPGHHDHRRRGSLRVRVHRPDLEVLEHRCLLTFNPAVSYQVGTNPHSVVTADFDNDGKLDLAVARYGGDVSVLLGNGDGTFDAAQTSTTGSFLSSLAVGDFDSDGNLDLASASYYDQDVRVLMGDGTGRFSPGSRIGLGSTPNSVAVGDFNGDGLLDLGVASNYYVYYYAGDFHPHGYTNVLLGNGDGSFSGPNVTWLGPGYHFLVAAANLNGDNFDDLVTVDAVDNTGSLLLGDSSGYLQGPSSLSTGSARPIAAGDLDADGDTDLVTASFADFTVGVMLGDGSGNFVAGGSYFAGDSLGQVVLGDFTADGTLDVVTWNRDRSERLAVLYGGGDGAFSSPVHSAVGSYAFSVAPGDFDCDGWLDVVTVNYGGGEVSVLINDRAWPTPAPSPPAVRIDDVRITEGHTGATLAVFTVTLSHASDQNVTVGYATFDYLGAVAGSDYEARVGLLTIPAGQTSATIGVPIYGDRIGEQYLETFFVTLTDPTNAFLDDDAALGTIVDDDPWIYVEDAQLTEGNSGTSYATFTVTLTSAYDEPVTIGYATANGTAAAGSDYQAASSALTFGPGETSKTISVLVNGDRLVEPKEIFFVNLSPLANANVADGQAAGVILDDEPRVSISDVTRYEDRKNRTTLFTFTITLSAAYDEPVTMSFATVNGTATTGDNDYVAKSGTLTFAPGETTKTITIEVKGDSKKEANETFYLDLFGLSSNALFTKNRGIGTILNDD